MEIEIISRENIKPSSPTPSHLRNYKLSLLDQRPVPAYVPMLLFYPPNTTDHHRTPYEKLQLLKESLSKTLSHYYPLAGKINDKLTIDCNDEGAYFAEARVAAPMTVSFLKQPDLELFHRLLPRESTSIEVDSGYHVSMFQVNVFDCGGIVVAIFVAHMVADGKAISNFLKNWASFANSGDSETESLFFPSYISSSLFPQNDIIMPEHTLASILSPFVRKGKCAARRFTFNSESLSALKAKVKNLRDGRINNPTRVQSVTALIWKSFITTRTYLTGVRKPSLVSHSVDLRRRASPPFPESCMGNFVWSAWAKCEDECGTELDQLGFKIIKAIKKADAHFVKQLEGETGVFKYREAFKEMRREIGEEAADCLLFTSWLDFGLYQIDFGWGKPALVTAGGVDPYSVYYNMVYLMETTEGDGMEAWVILDAQEMEIFECDRELLSYASVDCSRGMQD